MDKQHLDIRPRREFVQQTLKSPNIGSGVDLGRVRSFPYAAYDYISGKNLAALLAQANKQLSPIPTDHALLIAERIALALAAAYETRIQDERILHGFVVPQLVMISAGFDSRASDPLGRFTLTDRDFADLTDVLVEIARTHAGGRIVSVLEGGYSLEGLTLAVAAHLARL